VLEILRKCLAACSMRAAVSSSEPTIEPTRPDLVARALETIHPGAACAFCTSDWVRYLEASARDGDRHDHA
jgi:hypothetical protein